MERETEILAPAGSLECLQAAVAAGADAVYLGGSAFGARAYADNLDEKTLLEAIDYVHLHGRKIYLTVNTLLKEKELEGQLYSWLLPYYKQGLDAVIVQDTGVLRFIREHFPGLALHASTQMSVCGTDGALLLKKEGAVRVVTARELSLEEVETVARETGMEVESFVHGALCYCYSGQCLFSSFLGGRSGNRGQCAQPCRLAYRAEGQKHPSRLLSLKDMCTVEILPELIEAGICSFKIEGRMKKPEYVAGVTSVYRKYTDRYLEMRQAKGAVWAKEHFQVEEADRRILLDLYNRGGFHTGYYHTRNGREMMSLERAGHAGVPAVRIQEKKGRILKGTALTDLNPGDVLELPRRRGQEKPDTCTCRTACRKGKKTEIPVHPDTPFRAGMILNRTRNEQLIQSLRETWCGQKIKEKIKGKFILQKGKSAKLVVQCSGIRAKAAGDVPQPSISRPLDKKTVAEQTEKTGNTPFVFEELDVELEEGLFLPVQSIKTLRRKALEELEKKILAPYRREEALPGSREERTAVTRENEALGSPALCAEVHSREQLLALADCPGIRRIYVDSMFFSRTGGGREYREIISEIQEQGKEAWLILPWVFREATRCRYEDRKEQLLQSGWDGFLVRNLESFAFLKRAGWQGPVRTDFGLYQFNREAKRFWEEQGADGFTAPLELNRQELETLGLERGELVAYGYLPLMISAGCVRKTLGNCKKESGYTTITDRYRKEFVVQNNCEECYNILYNADPLYLGDQMEEIKALGPESLRLLFTVENGEECRRTAERYLCALAGEEEPWTGGAYTRGHFKRGIK